VGKNHNVRTIHIPKRRTVQMLRSAEDGIDQNIPGVYRIPCECRNVYVEQCGKSIKEVGGDSK
jgi:hypothetical protein